MRKVNKFVIVLTSLFLTSCQVYSSRLACPPARGVPCTSVHELEEMIIETNEGPDIFLGEHKKCSGRGIMDRCASANADRRSLVKVWIAGRAFPDGSYEDGHYIYIVQEAM